MTATFVSGADLKFAYLTNEYGTIISYKAGDTAWESDTSITFEWGASEQPTGVVPHIVYAESCADALYRNPDGTTVTTWVRQGSHGPTPRHATACTHMNMHMHMHMCHPMLGPRRRPARVFPTTPRHAPLNVIARAIMWLPSCGSQGHLATDCQPQRERPARLWLRQGNPPTPPPRCSSPRTPHAAPLHARRRNAPLSARAPHPPLIRIRPARRSTSLRPQRL